MLLDVADDGFATLIGLCRLFDLFSGLFPHAATRTGVWVLLNTVRYAAAPFPFLWAGLAR